MNTFKKITIFIFLFFYSNNISSQNVDTLVNDSLIQEFCHLDAILKTSFMAAVRSGKLTDREIKLIQSDSITDEEIKAQLIDTGVDIISLAKKIDINRKIKEKYPNLNSFTFLEATKQIRLKSLKEKNNKP